MQKGINLPIERLPHYQNYWKEYRWPTIVCKELGYKQYNVHDNKNALKIGGNAVETIWMLVKLEDEMRELLSKTKYIVLEITGNIRWYDEELHGGKDGYKYPNTIMEMIELINNPKTDFQIAEKTLKWINEIDVKVYMTELFNKIKYLKENYPDITFILLPWHNAMGDTIPTILKNDIVSITENSENYPDVNGFLQQKKLQVSHKAKAWNGNYQFNYKEEHASIEGHNRVANIVINHIKNLEKNE